jgi:PAS domain S-box-containing protein
MAEDRVNILVVDDMPEKLLVLESVLADLNENVVVARSGSEALEQVLKRDFAVILLDVNMPDIDGYETASFIRRRKRSAHTPIIFITGYADEMHRVHGYSLGAVDYILSPVVPEILRTKVKVFVDLYRMTQEVRRSADQRVALAREQAAREAAEQMAAALRESEERFRLAAEAVTGFIYEVDVATGRTTFSPGVTGLLGFTPEEVADAAGWECLVHPEDMDTLKAIRAVQLGKGREQYRCEYRVRHRDGHYIHVWDQGLTVHDAEGRPTRRVGNVVDISGQKKAQSALAEANRRKDEFLAMLAHELRNPLAPIRNAVHLLRHAGPSEPLLQGAREMIERNVNQMVRLVDDLLDVSRITRGKIRLEMEPVEMHRVVSQAIEMTRPLIESRHHRLTVAVPDPEVWVNGDVSRLAQVVSNLLNNAAKYTDEGGDIKLTLAVIDREAVLRVRDSGVGLPREMFEIVFELFTQMDRSLDRSQGGLGIGLTLVKQLVEMHGGRVAVSSDGPGNGSEFTVHVPLAEAPPRVTSASERCRALTVPVGCRALVIDDNVDAADSLAMLLRLASCEVRVAHDGPQALEIAPSFGPEVVLLDIGLPGLNGYEVARQLRAIPQFNRTLLIALTGYGQEEDRRRSFEAGFDHHLVKPVDLATLEGLLRTRRESPSTTALPSRSRGCQPLGETEMLGSR